MRDIVRERLDNVWMHMFGMVALLVVVVAVIYAAYRLAGARLREPARAVAVAAVVSAIVIGLVSVPLLLADNGGAVGVASTVAPPIALTALSLASLWLNGRFARMVIAWFMAIAMCAFIVIYGLGLGVLYVPTAILLVAVAAINGGQSAARVTQPER